MRVLVFGGTHGNEWTGIMAITHYAEKLKQKFPELKLEFILSNPEAYKINKRFKDEDLNRAFQFLNEQRPHSYEHMRAHEIKKLIEAEESFIIDLHTTTANLGSTLILTHYNGFNFSVAQGVLNRVKDCRIIGAEDPQKKYLGSQSKYGLMIEVGPIANGTVEANALERTVDLLESICHELVDPHEKNLSELDIYEEVEDVFYPKDHAGNLSAYIHPEFQGQDFVPVKGKYIPFKSFQNENIEFLAKEELFPIFINEAAYYPTGLAYSLCRKIKKKI